MREKGGRKRKGKENNWIRKEGEEKKGKNEKGGSDGDDAAVGMVAAMEGEGRKRRKNRSKKINFKYFKITEYIISIIEKIGTSAFVGYFNRKMIK